MSSTSSAALAGSVSALSEKASAPLHSARSTLSVVTSSGSIGRTYRSMRTSVITAGFPCQDLSVAGKRAGLEGSQSSLMYELIGLLSRTSTTPGGGGCPSCGALCGDSGIPACHFKCPPVTLARATKGDASSLLPTPTASSYGSCRGGGAGRVGKWRKSLDGLGIGAPEQRERMLGFPFDWTEITRSVTPSCPSAPSSSLEQS
jgi:hypothetical protein